MNKEPLYDYGKGLNAPYWIQEIKTKRALAFGISPHPCSCPFLLFFVLVLVFLLLLGAPILVPLAKLTHSISLLLYWYVPYKLAKFYTEYEPHGKKMHVFIWDYLSFFWEFKLNKKAIYQNGRQETVDEIVFEKTHL